MIKPITRAEILKHQRLERESIRKARKKTDEDTKLVYARLLKSARLLANLPELDWFVAQKIYVKVQGGSTKKEFSELVSAVALALGEAPNVAVDPGQYVAEFPESLVQVYVWNPTDCKLIEVEEVRKVMKPHPGCLAALQSLEQVV
jgi:hypothetical protein